MRTAAVADAGEPSDALRRTRSAEIWAVARARPGGAIGVTVLSAVVLLALLAPVIAPYGVREKVGPVYAPPSSAHLLGLDDAGIDMVTLLLWGARTSLLVGCAAAVIAMLIGGTIGLLAGYLGGKTDTVLMRITDYMLVLPQVPLLLVVAAVWGRSILSVIVIIGVLSWALVARVVRSQAKSLRERTYVQRARSIGVGHIRIMIEHVVPQIAPLLLAVTVFAVGEAILVETAIAFLGLGDPTITSWGRLIQNAFEGQAISRHAWWAIVPPGLAVGTLILSLMLIGRALDETLNPRLRSGHLSVRSFRVLRP